MSRIQTLTTSEADTSTKALYGQVQAKLGRVPNLMLTLGHSAAALGGYLQFNEALSHRHRPATLLAGEMFWQEVVARIR